MWFNVNWNIWIKCGKFLTSLFYVINWKYCRYTSMVNTSNFFILPYNSRIFLFIGMISFRIPSVVFIESSCKSMNFIPQGFKIFFGWFSLHLSLTCRIKSIDVLYKRWICSSSFHCKWIICHNWYNGCALTIHLLIWKPTPHLRIFLLHSMPMVKLWLMVSKEYLLMFFEGW